MGRQSSNLKNSKILLIQSKKKFDEKTSVFDQLTQKKTLTRFLMDPILPFFCLSVRIELAQLGRNGASTSDQVAFFHTWTFWPHQC